jgi:hypothetical protein
MAIYEQQAVLSPSFSCCEALKHLLEPGKTKPIIRPATA